MTNIYRKVMVRIWGDDRFKRLTPMQPSGQALWLYLLTGPHTGAIPGVFVAGRAAMAEALGWEQEAFDESMQEVLREGMAEYDAKARLWFLPKAIRHNLPANPNVVKSWRAQWSLVPDCKLRDRIVIALAAELKGFSEGFQKAFLEVIGEDRRNPSAKPLANQEQEQDQQQEQDPSTGAALALGARAAAPSQESMEHSNTLLVSMGATAKDAEDFNAARHCLGLWPIGRAEVDAALEAASKEGFSRDGKTLGALLDAAICNGAGRLDARNLMPSHQAGVQGLIAIARESALRNGVMRRQEVTS